MEDNIKTNTSESVYQHLLEMILSGKLKPDEKIPEGTIAKQLGVSRTPVRDALKQLDYDGLVTMTPNKAVRVMNYSEKEFKDIGVLRISLELMAIKLAILYGNRAEFLNLRQIAQMGVDDEEHRNQHDTAFHLELAKISKNDFLIKFQTDLTLRIQLILLSHPEQRLYREESDNEHFALCDALMAGDEKEAANIISKHLRQFYGLDGYYPDDFFPVYE